MKTQKRLGRRTHKRPSRLVVYGSAVISVRSLSVLTRRLHSSLISVNNISNQLAASLPRHASSHHSTKRLSTLTEYLLSTGDAPISLFRFRYDIDTILTKYRIVVIDTIFRK